MANGLGISLRVPEDLWNSIRLLAQEAGLSQGMVCVAGQSLPEKTLAKALVRAHKARKRSEYLSGGRYIWVDETLFKGAQKAAQKAEVSFSSFALALLFVTQRQRTKAFERLLKEKQTRNAKARAQRLRARARGLLKEAERLEASA